MRPIVSCLLLAPLVSFGLSATDHFAFAEELSPAASQGLTLGPRDWPWWRGPGRDGVASPDQQPPQRWGNTKNILWRRPIPGRGHGSVTVVGDQVVLAIADETESVQAVLCLHRQTGQQLWRTDIHQGGLTKKGNKKSTQASTTIACDGDRLFVNFLNSNAIFTTALSRDGKRKWQTKITDYTVHQGFGSSPALYGSLVLVSADNKGGGAHVALDRKSGSLVWKKERPKKPNYASPILLRAFGQDQLVFTGCDLVTSLHPASGKKIWEVEGATTECVTSAVTDGKLIFTSGGYPRNHVSAVRADGSGKVVWENNTRVYVPSMLVKDGFLYAVSDAGVAICYRCESGEVMWKARIKGAFTASPVLVGNRIYAASESGKTYVFKADPRAFELISENQLGDEIFATPTICGDRIYLRVAEKTDERRQEVLYCIGHKE